MHLGRYLVAKVDQVDQEARNLVQAACGLARTWSAIWSALGPCLDQERLGSGELGRIAHFRPHR